MYINPKRMNPNTLLKFIGIVRMIITAGKEVYTIPLELTGIVFKETTEMITIDYFDIDNKMIDTEAAIKKICIEYDAPQIYCNIINNGLSYRM